MAESTTSSFLSCNLYFNPLFNNENISALNTFSKVIRTCIGPHGKLKFIQNPSGELKAVTSSSERLFSSIKVKNCFSNLIISHAKSQSKNCTDGGLQCALLAVCLIQGFFNSNINALQLAALYEYFIKVYSECLKSKENLCILKIDFSNLQILQSLVITLLSSKPACLLSQEDKNHLCKLLLEAFLSVFPNSSRIMDNFNIAFITSEGNSARKSELFSGLLVKVSKIDCMLLKRIEKVSSKVALFTSSFAGDADFQVDSIKLCGGVSLMEGILKYLQTVVINIISLGIDIVFFQKVIHPRLKKQLQGSGVAVFEQIGCKTAAFLQYLLGGTANSSPFLPLLYGVVSCFQKSIDNNHYLLLNSHQNPFCSLLIYSYNEETLSELKIVCNQVISSLFHLLKSPAVCFGAGCTEIYTAIMLIEKVQSNLLDIATDLGCSQRKILSGLKSFLQSIINVAISSHQKSQIDFVVDTSCGHLWKLNGESQEETCCCGCCSFSSLKSPKFHSLYDIENGSFKFTENSLNKSLNFKHLILDLLNTKINSCISACEVATMLLKTDMCISC